MVVQVFFALATAVPSKYYVRIALSAIALVVLYAFAQGRTTSRERDLHARVIILTGGFTPLGLTLLTELASRGAHIIALSPYPLDHPYPSVLIPLLRSSTNNEHIYADHADLSDPKSIRDFCTKFLTGQDTRLDALVFAHEYQGIGSLFRRGRAEQYAESRETASLATFLIITLLLPALLVEPAERDIRIVSVVSPFYAAAAPAFTAQLAAASPAGPAPSSVLLSEGQRALRTAILTRHLQRVLDSLPNQSPDAQKGKETTSEKPVPQPSNILTVSACPGISRKSTLAPLLGVDKDAPEGASKLGLLIYFLFFPFLFLLTKSPRSSLQTVLHVLFLPSPLKRAHAVLNAALNPDASPRAADAKEEDKEKSDIDPAHPIRFVDEEVLKPGALYRECAVVQQPVPGLPAGASVDDMEGAEKEKGKALETDFPDDGELGGEAVGRTVWEWYEERLKVWEAKAGVKEDIDTKAESSQSAAGAVPAS
ncbi:hypothetical protein DAEQUDRAFT_755221 [Daedalea quercina L-15889]|uniref:Ketoreductase (KR) domain-containing protein n=1 Tax=Daedalea quercina L-15889 TaxID=1314783 RepID=A0A165SRY1_9APHY|nr:hypothetical protein DAEQUDRAFT_755221 [Daedalea quercina L-15889]